MSYGTMQYFLHENFKLAYRDTGGKNPPILLIHGFASSSKINWVSTGWFETLQEAGYRVIAIDNRGHGESDKSYNESDYTPEKMASDAFALLEYLKIEKAHIMGYSMGARITAFMALNHISKIKTIIFGGLAIGLVTGAGPGETVRDALLADDVSKITSARGMMFRKFADQTKSDRRALAACILSSKKEIFPEDIKKIDVPTLVAVGDKDDIAGAAEPLVELLPQGEAFIIKGRDHMLAVGDRSYKKAALEFLSRHPF